MNRLCIFGGDLAQRRIISSDLCRCSLNDFGAHKVELQLQANALLVERCSEIDGIVQLVNVSESKQTCEQAVRDTVGFARTMTEAIFVIVLPICIEGNEVQPLDAADLLHSVNAAATDEIERWKMRCKTESSGLKKCIKSPAVEERLEMLKRWYDGNSPNLYVLHTVLQIRAAQNDKDSVYESIFEVVRSFCPEDRMSFNIDAEMAGSRKVSDENLPVKAPTLHWTNWPRAEEMQLTCRVTFPVIPLLEADFRKFLLRCAAHEPRSEYAFEWIDGILLRFEPVKIFLGRHGAVYELSGRVDLDELDDGDLELPMKLVWEHFSAYLEIFLDTLEELPTIPYQIHVIPIGERFYLESSCQPPNSASTNNSDNSSGNCTEFAFDLTQLLTAMTRQDRIKDGCRFRRKVNDGRFEEGRLNIDQCFPDFRPKSLSSLRVWLKKADLSAAATMSNSNSMSNCQQHQATVRFESTEARFEFDNTPDEPNSSNTSSLLSPDAPPTNNFLSPTHGRRSSRSERRVSFGTISVEGIKLKTLEDPTECIQGFADKIAGEMIDDLLFCDVE